MVIESLPVPPVTLEMLFKVTEVRLATVFPSASFRVPPAVALVKALNDDKLVVSTVMVAAAALVDCALETLLVEAMPVRSRFCSPVEMAPPAAPLIKLVMGDNRAASTMNAAGLDVSAVSRVLMLVKVMPVASRAFDELFKVEAVKPAVTVSTEPPLPVSMSLRTVKVLTPPELELSRASMLVIPMLFELMSRVASVVRILSVPVFPVKESPLVMSLATTLKVSSPSPPKRSSCPPPPLMVSLWLPP